MDEIGSGIPFEEIYWTVLSKPFNLHGMAEINIAEIDTLEKKSKKDLILLFLKWSSSLNHYKKNPCVADNYLVSSKTSKVLFKIFR